MKIFNKKGDSKNTEARSTKSFDRIIPLPTMNEWWALTAEFPAYRIVSGALLKDYGSMAIMRRLRHINAQRVLEFGHGYDPRLALDCKNRSVEYWGVDDMKEEYFNLVPDNEYVTSFKRLFDEARHGNLEGITYLQGRLGISNELVLCPPSGYFDVVCSISVLEELAMSTVEEICQHAFELLRPGGELVCTYDTPFGHIYYPRLLFEMLRRLGFEALGQPLTPGVRDYYDITNNRFVSDLTQVVIENPSMVMFAYQHAEGVDRKYTGHWTTLFFSARKPQSLLGNKN